METVGLLWLKLSFKFLKKAIEGLPPWWTTDKRQRGMQTNLGLKNFFFFHFFSLSGGSSLSRLFIGFRAKKSRIGTRGAQKRNQLCLSRVVQKWLNKKRRAESAQARPRSWPQILHPDLGVFCVGIFPLCLGTASLFCIYRYEPNMKKGISAFNNLFTTPVYDILSQHCL